jgi:hypothetical protein
MLKKYLKILSIIITAVLLQSQQGCKLPDEPVIDPPNYTYETGMYYVGNLKTNGDARCVKGYILNGTQYAFLADGQKGLEVIDISSPQSPTLVFNYQTNGFAKEVLVDSVRSNKYVFISDEDKGLFILNITNPNGVYLDTLLSYTSGVKSSFLKNGYLYIALKLGAVKIVNINSLPDSVYEAGTYNPQNPVEHIEISGNNIYLLEKTNGVEIAGISNPVSPNVLSVFTTSGSCYNLKIADNLAYIADGTAGLSVVNIGNPAQPYFVSGLNTHSDVRGIDYSPNFLFTAEYSEGTEVFNVFNPAYPRDIGYYEAQGYCYGVNYFKGKVLVANGTYGLLILRF